MNRRISDRLFSVSALLLCLLAGGCSGHSGDGEYDDGMILELSVSAGELIADATSTVDFTVMLGEEDVTDKAMIVCVTDDRRLEEPAFCAEKIGTYIFRASYSGKVSEDVTVEAVSRFARRVCVMEFTGTWCSQCPDGAMLLNMLVEDIYPKQAYALAFHNNDEYTIPAEAELAALLGYDAYPSYSVDMRDVGELSGNGCRNAIKKSLNEYVTHCSVSVSSIYDADSRNATVSYKVFSEKDARYRVAAYVVEDRVKGRQMESNGLYDENYTHRHLVRSRLSVAVAGDDIGAIAVGEEKAGSFELSVQQGWNKENLSVAVLAVDEDGHVNNMATCAVDGGKMDYEYKNR